MELQSTVYFLGARSKSLSRQSQIKKDSCFKSEIKWLEVDVVRFVTRGVQLRQFLVRFLPSHSLAYIIVTLTAPPLSAHSHKRCVQQEVWKKIRSLCRISPGKTQKALLSQGTATGLRYSDADKY